MCGIDELIIKCREESGWNDCSKCMNKSNIGECMSELRGIQKHYFKETVFDNVNTDLENVKEGVY